MKATKGKTVRRKSAPAKDLSKGQNIRLATEAWKVISKYCKDNGLVMGVFVANTVLSEIKNK